MEEHFRNAVHNEQELSNIFFEKCSILHNSNIETVIDAM